ncbi:MAG TPA: hypothetical protein VF126_14970 [Acidobacteriaceae bacterium]
MPDDRPWSYENVWAVEDLSDRKRLIIAPKSTKLDIFERLAEIVPESFWLLYVLVVPRGEGNAGRYQSCELQSLDQVRRFLHEFKDLLETDGRQNLWIHSTCGSATLVFDRHGLVYGYGPVNNWTKILKQIGLTEVPSRAIKIPNPHSHHYHAEFDAEARRLLEYLEWRHTPLRDQDLE